MKTDKLGAETIREDRGGVVTLLFPRLADPKVMRHAVSTRLGGVSGENFGSLNLSLKVGDNPIRVRENRDLLFRSLDMDQSRLVTVNQVHGDKVLKTGPEHRPEPGENLGDGDGLITNEPGVPIAILVADCLPVMIFDPVHKAIGLAHAGWRGTVNHVAPKTLLTMGDEYGTKAEEVRVALGPCIGPCCYEVGADVKAEFEEVFPWGKEVLTLSGRERWKLDLPEANARQLLEIGVKAENLIRPGLCTVENMGLFYSHRVEASEKGQTGRVGAVMMVVE